MWCNEHPLTRQRHEGSGLDIIMLELAMTIPAEMPKANAQAFTLRRDEVHIWPCGIAGHHHRLPEFEASLSHDERARAAKFRFQESRDAFVVSRGLLRSLLGRYLDEDPGLIRFGYNPCGKPFLAGSHRPADIHFNLAHSHGATVFVFALGRQLGVDVEFVRADLVIEDARLFAPAELQPLRSLSGDERARCFFRLWTRKEALLKAMGTGFNAPSKTLHEPDAHRRWLVVDMDCFAGYAAALAVEGAGFKIIRQCQIPAPQTPEGVT